MLHSRSTSGRLPPTMPMASSAVRRAGSGTPSGRAPVQRATASPAARPINVWVRLSNLASALDDVDREAPARGFLVLGLHVGAGLAHGLDHLVERDIVS